MTDEELKKAAREYAKTKKEFEEKQLEIELPMGAYFMSIDAFLAGAKWQAEQEQETIELAEDHAYFAGKEKLREAILEWAKKRQCEQGFEDGEAEHGYQSAIQDLIKHIESL